MNRKLLEATRRFAKMHSRVTKVWTCDDMVCVAYRAYEDDLPVVRVIQDFADLDDLEDNV